MNDAKYGLAIEWAASTGGVGRWLIKCEWRRVNSCRLSLTSPLPYQPALMPKMPLNRTTCLDDSSHSLYSNVSLLPLRTNVLIKIILMLFHIY